MRRLLLSILLIVALGAFAAPVQTVWLSDAASSAAVGTPSPNVDQLNRSATTVTFTVKLNGFAVEKATNGVALRVGGQHEAFPKLGTPDISGVTVFVPFNFAVKATASVVAGRTEHITTDRLGGAVAIASDPEFPNTPLAKSSEMPRVTVGEPGVFKDFGVVPVTVYPLRQLSDGTIEAISELTITLTATVAGPTLTGPITPSYHGIYETMFLGYNPFSMGRSLLWRPGTYVIVRPSSASYNSQLLTFTNLKKMEGYNVATILIPSGANGDQIKLLIADVYNSLAHTLPVEYVAIIGDADRLDNVPTFPFTVSAAETVPSDLNYVLLDGSDFWPEAFLGRISYGSTTGLATIVNKTQQHQNSPGTGNPANTNYMNKAFCFAGNYSDTGSPPITPTENTRWAAQMLRDFGYNVSTYLYPMQPAPGTDSILALINQGVSLITYRGWGDSQGPLYPRLQRGDLANVTRNDAVMLSIVCQNGRYAALNSQVDGNQCFGEAWVETGSPSVPKCGPAFFGAAHLHTSTRYNNPILAGLLHGWLNDGLNKLGPATLRGKLEVYQGFPNEMTAVEQYFRFYNILGDPSLTLWYKTPDTMQVTFPTTLNPASSSMTIRAVDQRTGNPLPNMVAALIVGNAGANPAVSLTDAQGYATLPLRIVANDTVRIAVRGGNYRPVINYIQTNNPLIGQFRVDSVFFNIPNTLPSPGVEGDINILIKNVGTTAAASQAILSQTNTRNRLVILNNSSNAGTVNAGATTSLTYRVKVVSLADRTPESLRLTFASGAVDFAMPVAWALPRISGIVVESGSLTPGVSRSTTIQVHLKSEGNAAIPACNYQFVTFSNGMNITTPAAYYMAIRDSGFVAFDAEIAQSILPGHIIPIRMLNWIIGGSDTLTTWFNITCGTRASTMPTGPDNYGYYAYEEIDVPSTGTWPTPTYNWIELDTALGGNGTSLILKDDTTYVQAIPFPFTFYGRTYNQFLSICSNGWVSFDSTWMYDFYNWTLPNSQGPRTLLAANWDDLKGSNPADSGRVRLFYRMDNTPGDRKYIIEWAEAYSRYGIETNPIRQKFEIILYGDRRGPSSDNIIDFQYHTSSDVDQTNNYTTMGIMNWEHTDGLDLLFAHVASPGAEELHNNHIIRFSTQTPDGFTGVDQPATQMLPKDYVVSEAYPNPFNPSMTMKLSVPKSGFVSAKVFDQTGREVAVLSQGNLDAGTYTLHWNASGNASGVYYVMITADNFKTTRKVVFMK